MADMQSTPAYITVLGRNGRKLRKYERRCFRCGKVSFVNKKLLGKPCWECGKGSRRTHGLSNGAVPIQLYNLWRNVTRRCHQPTATDFHNYGGRGISVCDEWRMDGRAFVDWAIANGWKPGLEIDRIDNDGNYEPSNCRFVTKRENRQRTRRCRTTANQVAIVRAAFSSGSSVKEAASAAGVSYDIAYQIKNFGVWSNIP